MNGGDDALLETETRCCEIPAAMHGWRVDRALARLIPEFSRSYLQQLMADGAVQLLGAAVHKPSTRIQVGHLLQVELRPTQQAMAFVAQPMALDVVFEDPHLLVINKPAGVAVHGGSGVSFGVIEQLRMARPQAKFLELVHRLDRETSGILLVAKKRSALKNLQDQFRERQTGKTYLAMVRGAWPAKLKVLDKPLHKYLLDGKDAQAGERRVKVVARDNADGMPSVTLVKVREQLPQGTLLEVTIKTGRTHQIRVHLASEGHPILGDDKYGDFDLNKTLAGAGAKPGLKRMFLHAWRLQFNHPVSGERLEILAELPSELSQFLSNPAPVRPSL